MVLKNLPPLPGLIFNCNAYPTLARGATFCRRYAAVVGCASRDILDSSGHRPPLQSMRHPHLKRNAFDDAQYQRRKRVTTRSRVPDNPADRRFIIILQVAAERI